MKTIKGSVLLYGFRFLRKNRRSAVIMDGEVLVTEIDPGQGKGTMVFYDPRRYPIIQNLVYSDCLKVNFKKI